MFTTINQTRGRPSVDVNDMPTSQPHGTTIPNADEESDSQSLSTPMSASTSTPIPLPFKYEWATGIVEIIHSVLAIIATHILAILEFFLMTNPCQFVRQTWNSIWGQVTIEVVTTTEVQVDEGYSDSGTLTVIENSVSTVEEYLQDCADAEDAEAENEIDRAHDQEFTSNFLASSNYGSSDGEAAGDAEVDSGLQMSSGDEEEFRPMHDSTDNREQPQEVEVQHEHIRRDSGSTDDDDDDDDGYFFSPEAKAAWITQKLISQVELMFSDDHLEKDGFLLKHVRRRSDGYVSLKLVAGLRKVKQISKDFPTILAALRLSLKLDVNLDGTKIRRMEPLSPYLRTMPISGGNKEKESTNANKDRPTKASTQDEMHSANMNTGGNNYQPFKGYYKKNYNYNSNNTSPVNSNPGSRRGSFSKQYYSGTSPADLLYRNVQALSSGDESSSVGVNRRRGGTFPIPMNGNANSDINASNHYYHASGSGSSPPTYYNYNNYGRNSMYLSPTSSPPNGIEMPSTKRPKSNSFCEGGLNNFPYGSPAASSPNGSGMSVWLQRRMASAKSAEGSVELNGVIRQPRGPDGTRGFVPRNQRQKVYHCD